HWPGARLAAVVHPSFAGVLALNPDVDETLPLPVRASEWPGFLLRLRRGRFTHVFDLDNTERTALLARLPGAPFGAVLWHGHGHARARWRPLYTTDVRDPPEVHERRSIVEYYLAALSAARVPVTTREVRLTVREDDLAAARKLAAGPGGRKFLVHP